MRVNTIVINQLSDFQMIINSPFIPVQNNINDFPNMWAISFSNIILNTISLENLAFFVNSFLMSRQQLMHKNFYTDYIFYMWFDELAMQLRFNIIHDSLSLSFGCSIKKIITKETILEKVLESNSYNSLEWKNLKRTINFCEEFEEDEENDYVLEVFMIAL